MWPRILKGKNLILEMEHYGKAIIRSPQGHGWAAGETIWWSFLCTSPEKHFALILTLCFVLSKWRHFPCILTILFLFIYFWERERECELGKGQREGERGTESEAGSRLWAASTQPHVGLKLTSHEIMTWARVGCLTDWATQAPHPGSFSKQML